MEETNETIRQVLEQTLAPLVHEDGGRLFLVQADRRRVAIHLHGSFSGCPGNSLVIRWVIEPALKAVAPHANVEVTSGELIPKGALPMSEARTA